MQTPDNTSKKYLSLYLSRTIPSFFAPSISHGMWMCCFSSLKNRTESKSQNIFEQLQTLTLLFQFRETHVNVK